VVAEGGNMDAHRLGRQDQGSFRLHMNEFSIYGQGYHGLQFPIFSIPAPQIKDSPQRNRARLNPKSEYRNPKQIRISKNRMTETLYKSF
jgi:hypothetical protein